MKKKNIFIMSGVILLVVILAVVLYFVFTEGSDAVKFKEEYEALNGTVRESDGEKYNEVSISRNNPIKYINTEEALKIIEEESAIIYVGAPWCPWCRNSVPVLFEAAEEMDVDTIYYLDLDDEKSIYEVKDKKLVKTSDGSEGYYKLLDKLSEKLNNYVLTDEEGNKYDTLEKRIYMPYVIGVKAGRVVMDHVGTVSLNEDQNKYNSLTSKQKKELKKIYVDIINNVYEKTSDGICNNEEVCY